MNFPMGGIGNIVVDDKTGEHRIGYEGLFNSGRQQWGTLLVKLSTDRKTDSGYMMVGVEGTGPYMKNHIGADHGVVASVKARFGKIGGTSVTGQDKGKVHGVMESKGGTRTRIYQSSLENVKSCWQELKQLDPEEQATVLDKLLKADNSDARHELRSILQEV